MPFGSHHAQAATKTGVNALHCDLRPMVLECPKDRHTGTREDSMAGDLFLVLGWGAPIGIGFFLLCLGGMIFLLAKADEASKRAKAHKEQSK